MNLSARAHKNLQSALAGALLGGLMASPRAGAAAVLNGLTAFTQGVLPFLFPFSCQFHAGQNSHPHDIIN